MECRYSAIQTLGTLDGPGGGLYCSCRVVLFAADIVTIQKREMQTAEKQPLSKM